MALFMESLNPFLTTFLNNQEGDPPRRTWNSRIANNWIFYFRESWWNKYRISDFQRPIFYIVIGNYKEAPGFLKNSARLDHTLLERDDCPEMPDGINEYFRIRGTQTLADAAYPGNLSNRTTEIGTAQIEIPQRFLMRTANNHLVFNNAIQVDKQFADQIIGNLFTNNRPLNDFLEFLRDNNF